MKIVVIGAGMGGMCAAARLARNGHQVSIYEASNRVGGKLHTQWIGKCAFDVGPSLLTLPAVYRDFFLKTGKPMEEVIEISPVNPSFDYRFADGKAVQFANLSRFETLNQIRRSFGEESAKNWDQLMRRAEKMWDVSREPFIESELRSPLDLLKRASLLKDLRIIAPWKSLREFSQEFLPEKNLRFILDRYATYSGSDPRSAPAVLASIAFVEEAFGAWHVKGGLGALADAVHQRALDCGVEFQLNSSVKEILLEGKSVAGILLEDGSTIKADAIVANADASIVYQNLITKKISSLKKVRKQLKKADSSLAGFSLLLGMRKSEKTMLEHHTILFPENYDAEFEAIFTHKRPVTQPTIYICVPKDESMSKDKNLESWFVLVNAPTHGAWDWNDEKFNHEYANKIIDQIEARGICVRENLETLAIRTPADLEREVCAPGGAIYGASSNGARAAFNRPKNRSPIKGLYCVGGSAHPGGGLPLVGIGAEIVANAIGRAQKK